MERTVIIGGGVMGTTLGASLSDRVDRVTLVEKEELGAGTTGKSIANFAWHLNTRPDPDGIVHALTERSWGIYDPLIGSDLSFRQIGWVVLEDDAEALSEKRSRVDATERPSVRAETLSPEELARFGLDAEAVGAGGLHFPDEGRLDPEEVVTTFEDQLRANGGEVRQGTEVTDIVVDDGAVVGVETSEGTFDADVVVNAAGPWAPAVNRMAGVSVPLKHTEAPILVMDSEEGFGGPSVSLQDGVYVTGEASGRTLGGHYPLDQWEAGTELSPDADQGVGRGTVSERFREKVVDTVHRLLPALQGGELTDEWQGVRCVTPDGRPVVGATSVDGFYLATGMSGEGITLGPACSAYLADHLETGTPNPVVTSLSPERFDAQPGS